MPNKIDLGSVTSYAMAKDAGFAGTEAEWAAALVAAGNNYLDLLTRIDQLNEALGQNTKTIAEHDSSIKANTDAIAKRYATEKVGALPETGADKTLYMVPAVDGTMLLIYLWQDNSWVQVGGAGSGDGTIDEEALSAALENYYDKDGVDALLASVKKEFYSKVMSMASWRRFLLSVMLKRTPPTLPI